MGGKTKRRFALEPDRESAPTHHHTCRTCRKFRWTLLEDVEYDGDDEREVRPRKLVQSEECEDLEPDEREPPCQKRKFDLTVSQREKGVTLANYPDPSGPPKTDGEDMEPDEREPPCQKRKFELTASQREKGAALVNPDPWDPPRTDREDLAPVYKGWGSSPPRKQKLLDLNREPDDENDLSYLSDQATEKVWTWKENVIDLAVHDETQF